jgi:iron complex transport system substrate-binding protein
MRNASAGWWWLWAALMVIGGGCQSVGPAARMTPMGAARSPRLAAIVEPRAASGAFPRTVRDVNGEVVIQKRPERIHTLSVGYDEITFRLVEPARIVAVGTVTANPDYSNVAEQAARIPGRVGREAEQILAQNPDLVVASPFANADLIKQLRDARVPLVVADLVSSIEAQAENIRLLAYLYGEEERGEALVREVDDHIARLRAVVDRHPRGQRPSAVILSGGQSITIAGDGTTEDGVLQLAGARNAAAEAGIVGNRDIALEVLPDLRPDVVLVTEANPERPTLLPRLRDHPVVGALPAFRDNRVVAIKSSLLSTLSQWNVVGAEQLNRVFYPGELP